MKHTELLKSYLDTSDHFMSYICEVDGKVIDVEIAHSLMDRVLEAKGIAQMEDIPDTLAMAAYDMRLELEKALSAKSRIAVIETAVKGLSFRFFHALDSRGSKPKQYITDLNLID